MAAEDSDDYFEKVMNEIFESQEYVEETQKFFQTMEQTMSSCYNECGEDWNCNKDCCDENFFKSTANDMEELDVKLE